jgi:ParB/RepB/Spo0J family partition protein
MEVKLIALEEMISDPTFNCRGVINPSEVQELAEDIEANGLMQPIMIQPFERLASDGKFYKYRVVAGNCRYKAHELLGKKTIPCIIRTDIDETQARVMNLSENLKRRALSLYQEAKGIEALLAAGLNEYEVADRIGKSRGWVQCRWLLLKLPVDIQELAAKNILSQASVRDLYSLRDDKDKMYDLAKRLKIHHENNADGSVRSKVVTRTSANSNARRVRCRGEVDKLVELLAANIGYGIHTRVAAWCSGGITDRDMIQDIKTVCDVQNKLYTGPNLDSPICG